MVLLLYKTENGSRHAVHGLILYLLPFIYTHSPPLGVVKEIAHTALIMRAVSQHKKGSAMYCHVVNILKQKPRKQSTADKFE